MRAFVLFRPITKVFAVLLFLPLFFTCSMNQVGLGAKVDITPPKLGFTGPATDGLYKNGTVHLTGTASDDIALTSVAVTFPTATGDQTRNAAVSGGLWSLDLTSGAGGDLPEGAASITVAATDSSGKAVTQTRLIYVDNLAPTVLVQAPTSYDLVTSNAPLYSDYIDIKGEVFDGSPVRSVVVTLYKSDNSVLASKTADGTNTFSTRFLLKKDDGTGLPAAGLLGSAQDNTVYRYTVVALDAAGNQNTYNFHRQDVYAAMTASSVPAGTIFPTVDEIGSLDGSGSGTSPSGITWASLAAVRQNATPASAAYNFAFQYTSMPTIRFITVDPDSPTNIVGVSAIISGTIQPPASAGSAVLAGSVETKVYSGAGFSTLLFTETGSTTNQELRSVGDSLSYSLTLKNGATPLSPGAYRMIVRAQATGSSWASKTVDFFVDSGAPFLDKSTTTDNSSFLSAKTTLAGVASSPTGLQKVDIFEAFNGGAPTKIKTITLSSATAGVWASDPVPSGAAADGNYDYVVTLTTDSGKTTSVYHNLTWDTTLPSVAINSVTPLIGTQTVNGTIAFSASVSDANGLSGVKWGFLPTATPAPAWSDANWTSLPTPPYQSSINTTGNDMLGNAIVDNTGYTLWVLAKDKAGNPSSAHFDLTINQSSDTPVITLSNLDASATTLTLAQAKAKGNLLETGAKVSFALGDDDNANLTTAQIKIDDITNSVAGSFTSLGLTGTSKLKSSEYSLSSLPQGLYAVTLRVSDSNGLQGTLGPVVFAIDTAAPTLTVSTASGAFQNADFALAGTALDALGLDTVSAVVIKDDSLSAVKTFTPAQLTGAPAIQWTTTIVTGALSAGVHNWTVTATDSFGKTTVLPFAFTLDKTAPVLAVTVPAAATWYKTPTLTLTATATDVGGTGVASVRYSTDAGVTWTSLNFNPGPPNWTTTLDLTALGDSGSHSVEVRALDQAGNLSSVTRAFQVDQTAPSLTETGLGTASSMVTTNFTLSGAASDATSGLAAGKISVSKDGGAATLVTVSGGLWTYPVTIDSATHTDDGDRVYTITATDAAGSSTVVTRTVTVDTVAPLVDITSVNPVVGSNTVNGRITFNASVFDANGLATGGVKYFVKSSGGAPLFGDAGGTVMPSAPYSAVIDTTALTDLTTYTLYVLGKDRAGNVSTISTTLAVDQSTDLPVFSGLNLDPLQNTALLAANNLTGSGAKITGTLADDDGLLGADVKIVVDAAPAGDFSNMTALSTVPGNGKSVSFTHTFSAPSQGVHYFYLRVLDNAALKSGKPAQATLLGPIYFAYDTADPVLVVTQPSGNWYKASFTLSGTASDSNALKQVDISTNGGSSWTTVLTAVANSSPQAWSQSVAGTLFNGSNDGTYTYKIRTLDIFDKTTMSDFVFKVDTQINTPSITSPASDGGYQLTSGVSLAGSASDVAGGSQIALVEYSVDGGTTWAAASGSTSWFVLLTGQTEGAKSVKIRATDAAGNVSATATRTFIVDLNAPTLPSVTLGSGAGLQNAASIPLAFSAADSLGLANITVTQNGTTVYNNAASGTSASDTFAITGQPDAAYTYVVTATDGAGRQTAVTRSFTLDRTAPTLAAGNLLVPASSFTWYNGTNLGAVGTATDANGVTQVEVATSTDNITWSGWALAAGTTNWTASLNLVSLGEGTRWFRFRATDAAGNVGSALSRSFGIDQTAPTTSETALGAATSKKVLFDLGGTASDTNALASILVTEKKGAAAATTVLTQALSTTSQAWTTGAGTLPSGGLVDDTYLYTITVTDVAGNTYQTTRSVRVDLTAPSLLVTSLSGGQALSGSAYNVTGTSTDGTGSGVASVEFSTDGGTTWVAATGTTTWSALLDLTTLGEGSRTLKVRSTDAALNQSSVTTISYYIDQTPPTLGITTPSDNDVYNATISMTGTASDANLSTVKVKLNGGSYTLATGTTSWTYSVPLASLNAGSNTLTVEAADLAGRTTTASRTVYKDQAAPALSFSNLAFNGSSVLSDSSPKALGTITDLTSVVSASTYVESWDYSGSSWNGTAVEGWTTLAGSGTTLAFTKDFGITGLNLADGKYRISLKANDGALPAANATSGVVGTANESAAFLIDRANPSLALTVPTNNSYQKASFAISGTSADANTVTSVLAKVDSSDFSSGTIAATSSDGFATWTATVSTTGLTQGGHTLYVQALDGSGRASLVSRDFTFDNVAPAVSITDPQTGSSVNGAVKVRGTSSDSNAVTLVEIQIGKDPTWVALGGIYNWEYNFANIDTFANTTYANETSVGSGIWRLDLVIRARDNAGNFGTTTAYSLDLDPNGDSPITTIYQPLDNSVVGGATRVYGIATDDDAVFRSEMRIDVDGDNLYTKQIDYWNGSTVLGADGDATDLFEDETQWYPVNSTGLLTQNSNWYQVLNQIGEYNAALAGQTRTIHVQVRAVDTKNGSTAGIPGNAKNLTLTFDNTIPTITNVVIDPDAVSNNGNEIPYSNGIQVSGTFYVVATVKDNSGITRIDLGQEGPLSGTTRIDTDGSISTYLGNVSGFDTWTIRIPVDSRTIGAGIFNNTSGTFALSLKATDNASPNPFVTFSYITVQVDNYFPTGAYTNAASVVGTNYRIQGTSTDVGAGSGIVQGISKIVTWWEKSGSVYDPRSPLTSASLAGNSTSLSVKDMTAAGVIQNISYPNAAYRASIDSLGELGNGDAAAGGDNDGYNESLTLSGNTSNWWAEVNTMNLPDGPITLHYAIFDKAANVTHYTQTLFVRNNGPTITSIDLGTDLDGDGTISAGEITTFSSGYTATGFLVRNNRLSITVNKTNGNNTVYYSVKYPNSAGTEQNGAPLTSATTTITDFGLIPDGTTNSSTFAIRIYDSTAGTTPGVDSLEDQLTLNLTIQNTDTTPPTFGLAPFGQRYNLPTPSNIDSAKALGAVGAYSETVANDGGSPAILYGHVEYPANSIFANGQANLSGQVIFRGKAWDNQRIARVTATIPGFNGGNGAGVEFDVARWTGTGLTGLAGSPGNNGLNQWQFDLDATSEAVTQTNGHLLNWSFLWDSSLIATVAQRNLVVTFKAYDFKVAAVGTRGSTTTVTSANIGSATIGTGTPIWLGTTAGNWTSGAWTTVASQAGSTLTLASASGTGNTAFVVANVTTSTMTVDVVPYITSIARTGGYSTSRTKYGKFPVSMTNYPSVTSATLDVAGFNLKPGQDAANDFVKVANSPSAALVKADVAISDNLTYSAVASPYLGFTATLDAATTHSGWLRLKVNNIEASNNLNTNTLAYNKEDDGTASTKWNDDRYLQLWWNGDTFPIGAGVQPQYPAMSQDTAGALWASWINYSNASINYGKQVSGGGTINQILNLFDPVEYTDIHVDAAGNKTVVLNTNVLGGTNWTTDASGGISFWSSANATMPSGTNGWPTGGATIGTAPGGTYWIGERQVWNTNLWQFQKPRIVRNGTSIHVVYWDTRSNSVKYTYRLSSDGAKTYATWINLDGGSDADDTNASRGGTGLVTQYNQTLTGYSSFTRSTSTGNYQAIDVDQNGNPVILYYDITGSTLRLARANSTTPTTLANWTIQPVFLSTDPNRFFTGRDVSMKFDTAGNLYVASFNQSSGQMVYLKASSTRDGAGNFVFGTSTVVDKNGTGTWSDLTVQGSGAGAIPYISYLNSSMVGTFNGIKMAYWDTSLTTPDWETVTVPLTTAPTDNRTNVEYNKVASNSVWQTGIGFKSSTGFDLSYLRPLK